MRRAAARTSASSTPLTRQYCGIGTADSSAMTSERPAACSASHAALVSCSSTRTAASAARSQASRPGLTCRWKSASAAVSVRRGSITISERAGSLAMFLSVNRACGMLCDCHGFFADEDGHLAVLEVAADRRAEHEPVDPDLAGLLLGDGAGAELGAERLSVADAVEAAAGGCPGRRRRNRGSSRRRRRRERRPAERRPRVMAVSQSISSKEPSARWRSGWSTRSPRPFW